MEEDCFNFLKQFSKMRTPGIAPFLKCKKRRRLSEEFAETLIKGGENIAWKMSSTVAKMSKSVAEMAEKHRSSVHPNEQQMYVHPLVETSVHYVHRGSRMVAKRVKYFVDKVGEIGMAMGRHLAATAEKCFGSGRSIAVISDTINVLGGSVVGGSTIWAAIGNALKTLCSSIANEIVDTVRAKYGEQASMTVHEALYATGHTSVAAFHLSKLLPIPLATRAAKKASKQLIRDLHKKQSEESLDSSGGAGRSGK